MADKKNLDESEMQQVSGGVECSVTTSLPMGAPVRYGPGLSFAQITSLKSGTKVNTTGEVSTNDRKNWYQISSPVSGWISSDMINLP
ncbi:MAG: SH3 domain-containing protein [Lachnospiraceae bacterium]|nr:SH3 domain-containing protein [Lachnospiraceae bacterium]